MRVIRKGKVKEVKKVWVGDIYIGKCWMCNQKCLCQNLTNGHIGHSPLTDDMLELLAVKPEP